jgi:hypothetical protein
MTRGDLLAASRVVSSDRVEFIKSPVKAWPALAEGMIAYKALAHPKAIGAIGPTD